MQGTQYATKRSILCRGAFCGPTVLKRTVSSRHIYFGSIEWSMVTNDTQLVYVDNIYSAATILWLCLLSLLDKFKVTSEHVLIIGYCPLM